MLVTAQVTSAVIGTSTGKVFASATGGLLAAALGLTVVTAAVNVVSLMLAAVHVNQGIFVPLQTCATLATNMVTGLIVWEDGRVIELWVAYVSLYLLMALGIYLLSDSDVVERYKQRRQARIAKKIASWEDVADVDEGAGAGAGGSTAAASQRSIWSEVLQDVCQDLGEKSKERARWQSAARSIRKSSATNVAAEQVAVTVEIPATEVAVSAS